jgi:hypothetical protein
MQDTRPDPQDLSAPPPLVTHFAFVALRRMMPTFPQTPQFCKGLAQFRAVVAQDPAILAAMDSAVAAADTSAAVTPEALPQLPPGLSAPPDAKLPIISHNSIPVRFASLVLLLRPSLCRHV